MSRVNSDTSRLRRLRRLGHRRGLAILAAKVRDPRVADGGYMLSIDAEYKVILGDKPLPYSASLDQIEAYLDGLEEKD